MKMHNQEKFFCEKCDEVFQVEDDLRKHRLCHDSDQIFACKHCDKIYTSNRELKEHEEFHSRKKFWKCNYCDKMFTEKSLLGEHLKLHEQQSSTTEHRCNQCENGYSDMRQLRRHDWRCHRSIECTICKKMLNSRQDISSHRQNEYGMFRKISCRFYPDCFDGEECLYEHSNMVPNGESISGCPNGQNCSDQSCSFNEQKHRNVNQNLCRFQARCNRAGCLYKHNVARQAFLGESQSKARKI